MIKLNETFQPKSTTIVKNLKDYMENIPEDSSKNIGPETLENVVSSAIVGISIYDLNQEDVDYTNKYKKTTVKESLQNYILTKLQNGVNHIPLFFIYELEDFGKFDYTDFVESLDEKDFKSISKELKSYFEDLLEFEQSSYSLKTNVEAINDPSDYGELIKVTTTISITQ